MKTYEERTQNILSKADTLKKRRRRITAAVLSLSCCLVLVAGLMFIPKVGQNPQEYEQLIKELTVLTRYDHIYEIDDVMDLESGAAMPEAMPDSNTGSTNSPTYSTTYEEVTDNQVQGVTEADLIKRSDSHIYYLRENTLSVYSISGEASKEVGSYKIEAEDGANSRIYNDSMEMYLSQDCTTVTVLTESYDYDQEEKYLYILSLDVSDPENISRKGHMFITGSYQTSRLIDGSLYLVSAFYVDRKPDYKDNSSFLPGYGTPGNMTYLPMEDIYIPEEPTSPMYTVVTKLDGQTLEVKDSTALLSYSSTVYVSQENIYLTRSYTDKVTKDHATTTTQMTEIIRLCYSGTGLENMGSFTVEGAVKNQYSLDEYDGMLRIVTTTDKSILKERTDAEYTYVFGDMTTNANLYCIDLSDHSIRSCVESFAPEGESVQSVRFDKEQAYVCTSIVLSDPVFFFDLSDPDHITWKDTGTIDGYSMSLVDFAEGFLMGIGYGDSFNTLKIEIYREGTTTVESHCTYEQENCWFSTNYKSYYIDRENQLIGLEVDFHDGGCWYILLHFDGYELVELVNVPLSGDPVANRAVYIDGYLYLFGDTFRVEKIK